MRYILRNKEKIKDAFGKDVLNRVLRSIAQEEEIDGFTEKCLMKGDQYETVIISDAGHSVNVIALYIVSEKFDVVVLAFKEFIG